MGRWPMGRPCPKGQMNSVVECSIAITEDGRARLVTYEFEKNGLCLECEVTDSVKELLKEMGVPEGSFDNGLVIFSPGEKMSESKVVDYISYHRHPEFYIKEGPTSWRYGISTYTEVFNALVRKEGNYKNIYFDH
ncbi:MAG: hypothetical protein MRJ68_15085 [Nitrospira sp.]|nr:hypothetical protein [Nitrospira sp.]